MLTDLREMISELREQYRECWLEEATPFRLPAALQRWAPESDYWKSMPSPGFSPLLSSSRVPISVFSFSNFSFCLLPPLESIRPKVK